MAETPHYASEQGHDRAEFLLGRAKRGDEHAFQLLLEQFAPLLDRLAFNYMPEGIVDRDDLRQLVAIAAWTALRKHQVKYGVGGWVNLLSKVAQDTLAADLAHRRRLRRWTGRTSRSIDTGGVDGAAMELAAPSWMFGADPVRVVIARENLGRGWAALKRHHQDAINAWLAREDDEPHDPDLYARVATARTIALRVIHREGDVEAAKDRKCAHCGDWIPATARADAIYCCDAHLRAARDARVRAARRDPARRCETCNGPIPEDVRADSKYCGIDCRREGARRRKRARLAAAA